MEGRCGERDAQKAEGSKAAGRPDRLPPASSRRHAPHFQNGHVRKKTGIDMTASPPPRAAFFWNASFRRVCQAVAATAFFCAFLFTAGIPCKALADAMEPAQPTSLTVAIDNDYPPYIYPAPGGGVQGILVDTWRLWEKKTGIPVALLPVDWSAAQDALRRGKADVIDTFFKNEAREKEYAFSKPYATIEVPIFVHKDLGGIRDLEALRGITVGVKRGDASVDFLTTRGILPLVTFDGYEALIRAAGDGRIKVFCVDKPPALHYLYKFGLENDFRLAFTLNAGQFHRAVRKDNAALLAVVENGFARITPAEHEDIDKKWRGTSLFPSQTLRYTLWVLLLVALAALTLLAVNALLRRRVRRQKTKLDQLLQTVQQNEARYGELVESAGSVIVRLDTAGLVTFCNTFGQHFFGYTQVEMLGRDLGALIDPPEESSNKRWAAFIATIRSNPEGGITVATEHRRRGGEPVWIAWSMRILRDPSGEIMELLCVGNDITERKRVEEALRASEARYTMVARGANDGIWDWDLQTNAMYFSPRYMEILGYGPRELRQVVEEWTKRLHPEDAETVIRENKRCADGEVDNFAVEYRMRHKDGSYRWVLGRGANLKDDRGVVIRMAGTHTDITRRKRDEEALRESQDQLSKIFRFSPVGLFVSTRRDGRIVDINEAGARMFGYVKSDILGRTSVEIGLWQSADDREALMVEMEHCGAIVGKELELRHKSGSSVVTLYSAVPNQAYGEPCMLSVMVDITERKAMEQALRRSKEAAESANKAKSEFLSTMSHEIRTPMNTILGMVDILAATALTPDQTQAVTAIENAGGNLLGLLNDILDLSQIEAGGLIMEEKPCDIVEMAEKTADMMRPDAERKGLRLRLENHGGIPAYVSCCPDRIRQVLVNLLGNAVKFTVTGEIVLEIGSEADPITGKKLRLAVRDTGIGIPADKLTFIFDRFTQINASASRDSGGVGLGLAICQKLVERMGGRIRVDSREGQGSTFIVTLPLRPTTMPARPASDGQASMGRHAACRSGTVLLVEDSATNAEVLRLMLEGSNFDLTWAPSGQAALEAFRNKAFDIVLMDVEMPSMDGYETTEALRKLEKGLGRPRTPVVALTAHAFEEHRQRSMAAGCDDFQVKPIPKARLIDTLETWMALRP
jgi:PAS domain S-box-containing protein